MFLGASLNYTKDSIWKWGLNGNETCTEQNILCILCKSCCIWYVKIKKKCKLQSWCLKRKKNRVYKLYYINYVAQTFLCKVITYVMQNTEPLLCKNYY